MAFAVLAAAIIVLNACPKAKADLGDTYSASCAKFGGQGHVDKQKRRIWWHIHHHFVIEAFVKNECVAMRLVPDKDYSYTVEDVERLLPLQCGRSQIWQPNGGGDSNYTACWATNDGLILAALYPDGDMQFAYTWWIKGKGKLDDAPNYGDAPIDDDPSTPPDHKELDGPSKGKGEYAL